VIISNSYSQSRANTTIRNARKFTFESMHVNMMGLGFNQQSSYSRKKLLKK
jgi:hypothetical protein